MAKVTCQYCGLPFSVRQPRADGHHFCCTGCAMLGRLPVSADGQFPVNIHLVLGLAAGFVFFNQLLFWLVGVLLAHDGRDGLAVRFHWLSAGAALAVWGTLAFMVWKERVGRLPDVIAFTLSLAGYIWFVTDRTPATPGLAVINLILIAWCFRGLLRKKR